MTDNHACRWFHGELVSVQLRRITRVLSLLPSLSFACRALDYRWIVTKCFQLREGEALSLTGLISYDLSNGFSLSILSVALCFVNCTKFGKLILTKNYLIVAFRCQLSRLKCTKFDFGWGSAQTPLGELTPLPRPPSWWLSTPQKNPLRLGPSVLDT